MTLLRCAYCCRTHTTEAEMETCALQAYQRYAAEFRREQDIKTTQKARNRHERWRDRVRRDG